jgi:hypothetical protein
MTREEINYSGVDIVVEGNYYCGENEIVYDSDMAGYPGSRSEFEIYDILIGDVSSISIFQDYQLEDIEQEVIQKIEG